MEEKKNNLTKIMDFMKGKDKVHISEISDNTGILKNSVMGCLNKYVLLGKCFTRLGNGYYKLKGEEDAHGSSKQKRPNDKELNETKQPKKVVKVQPAVS